MITASFDTATSRAAAISGVYQYDTGQRLRLLGLPTPQELAGRDDLLSGDMPAVQAQFGYTGDSQAEMRLAIWNEARGEWLVEVPDEFLTRVEPVHVYVYVYHGEIPADEETGTEERTRGRTMYEGVFTPISRPAPHNLSTPEQWEQWEVKLTEIDLATATTKTAEENALAEVDSTNRAARALAEPTAEVKEAGEEAENAAEGMAQMESGWEKTTISKVDLAPGSAPTITIEKANGARHITLGIPQGADGAAGEKGDTGPADITFVLDGTTLYTTTT